MIPNDTRPGPEGGGEMIECPVNGCPWRLRRRKPHEVPPVMGHTVDEMVLRTLVAESAREDAECRAHLAEHPVEDFLRTIAELREENADLRAQLACPPAVF